MEGKAGAVLGICTYGRRAGWERGAYNLLPRRKNGAQEQTQACDFAIN